MRLDSDGLLSKWGFHDGDIVDDVLWDLDRGDLAAQDTHPVLIDAVRTFLLPALDQAVEVVEIGTIHNPIRARRVDGRDISDDWYDLNADQRLTPEFVDVPDAWVVERAQAVTLRTTHPGGETP